MSTMFSHPFMPQTLQVDQNDPHPPQNNLILSNQVKPVPYIPCHNHAKKKNSLPVTEAHTKERKASWGHITWSNSDDIWTDIQHVQKYSLRYMYVLSGYSLTNASVSYLTNAGIGEIKVHGQVVLQILRVMLRHVELFWLLRFLEISSQWCARFRFDFLYGNFFIFRFLKLVHNESLDRGFIFL